jgi:molybdopterin-guanine dinucleotide biosynthesis protein A
MPPNVSEQIKTSRAKKASCSAAILAGGASSRMGANKALMNMHGEPLIARVAKALTASRFIDEVLLIANAPQEYASLKLPVYSDVKSGMGPLGGIYTALHYSQSSHVLVAACDLPFVTSALVDYLCQHGVNHDVFALESEKGVEPLCAVYAKACLPVIEKQLQENKLKVSDFYPAVEAKVMRLEASLPFYRPHLLANVNSPEEFAAAQKLAGS